MALVAQFKLDELSGGLIDSAGNIAEGTFFNSPTLGATGVYGTAVAFDGVNQYAKSADTTILDGETQFSVCLWVKNLSFDVFVEWYINSSNLFYVVNDTATGELLINVGIGGPTCTCRTASPVDVTDFTHVIFTGDLTDTSTFKAYVNKVDVTGAIAGASSFSAFPAGTSHFKLGRGWFGNFFNGTLDDVRIYSHILSVDEISDVYDGLDIGGASGVSSIPMRLAGYFIAPSASLPMRLGTPVVSPAASLPMRLESLDTASFNGPVVNWGVSVSIGGVDISDKITETISIEHEEDASGICSLDFIPDAGSIDPNAFERKTLKVSILLRDGTGATVNTIRLYTGTTSTASYDPDTDLITVDATTDLAGWLENVGRGVIDTQIGGYHSPHVFDDSADGYQYAKDRLSTIASEMHIDNYGQFKVVPWAAKGSPDVTLTDASRFDGTLRLVRASRRDLLTRVRVNFDFRFTRLRHRQITLNFVDSLGLCSHLEYNWRLPSKDMVRSAFDGTEWTRINEIQYVELPTTPQAGICSGKNWNPGSNNEAADFCLGAVCTMARRWAQTVTEEYAVDVIASDLEEAIGQQQTNLDYGVEATFDAGDFERITSFTDAPAGSSYSTATADWQKDATYAEFDGRTEMENAQECAIALARSTILGRARGNRLSLSPVFRPDITLASTVRVNTPWLVATGKVAKIRQALNVVSGDLDMTIELAISRHDGSGLAGDDPVAAPDTPDQPQETPTARTYYLGYRLGALAAVPEDDEEWDGYMCNPQESLRFAGAPVYRERLVVKMPEIEETARNATTVQQTVAYSVAVPNDELTMSS